MNLIKNDTEIETMIFTIRGLQVMLDKDLAILYGVETKRVNEAVRNNTDKFPTDFYFEMNEDEFLEVRSNISTTNFSKTRTIPKVFTEQGVYMLATILKSKIATDVTVSIIRTFATMRKLLNENILVDQQLRELQKRQLSYELETDEQFEKLFNALEDKSLKPKQGIFFDGQTFDAYVFVVDLIKSAKTSLVLIDNYVDESVLILFSKRDADVQTTIYTKTITKQIKLDLDRYNAQYEKIDIKKFDLSHDRFLIIDD